MQRNNYNLFLNVPKENNHDIFLQPINKLIAELGDELKAFHLSELLREIANSYLDGMKRHNEPSRPTVIHYMCFDLLEKAMILEPQSENAKINYLELLKVIPTLSHDHGVYNEQLAEERRSSHRMTFERLGGHRYFISVLTAHINELSGTYGYELPKILQNLLDHLSKSNTYNHIKEKYFNDAEGNQIDCSFKNAMNNLRVEPELINSAKCRK